MSNTNSFWAGFMCELDKEAQDPIGIAAQLAAEQPVATAAAVGLPVGVAAIGVKRAIQRRKAKAPVPKKGLAVAPRAVGKIRTLLMGAGLLGGGYLLGKTVGRKATE